MSEDINYAPPFPASPLMKPNKLFDICREFRDWLDNESQLVHEELGLDCCRKLRSLPKVEQFLNLSFIQHTGVFMALRNLRETYDAVARSHDDNWCGKASLRLRHMLVQEGILILEYAFLPLEALEAKLEQIEEEYVKQQQGHFQRMFDMLMGKKKGNKRGQEEEEGGDDVGGDEPDAA